MDEGVPRISSFEPLFLSGQRKNDGANDGANGVAPVQNYVVLILGVVAVVCIVLGSLGLNHTLQSNYAKAYSLSGLVPFEVTETFGMLAWECLIPVAIALFFTLLLAVMRNPTIPLPGKAFVVAAFFVCGLATLGVGVFLAQSILGCGVVFCAGAPTAPAPPYGPALPTSPDQYGDGHGLHGVTGLWLFLVGLALSCSCAVILARLLFPRPHVPQLLRNASPAAIHMAAKSRRKAVSASILALVVLPSCVLLTAVLPNCFSQFHLRNDDPYSHNMVQYMKQSEPAAEKGAEKNGAVFKTIYWTVSDDLTLKFYPDVMIFYCCLEAVVLVALVAAWVPSLAQFCSKRRPGSFSIGEFCMMGVLSLMTILWTIYWGFQHSYHEGRFDQPVSEVAARTFGSLAVLFMSLALLPASRNSLWIDALGVSFEATLWGHRLMGGLSLLMTVCHFLSFWVRFSELSIFTDVLTFKAFYPLNGQVYSASAATSENPHGGLGFGDQITIPMAELVVYPSVILMGVLPLLRRINYEVFRYAHYTFMVLIPVVLLHATSGWYFLIGGIAFWLVDASVRFVRGALPSELTSVAVYRADGGITELRFEKSFEEPGMYCFINVPQVSLWQWHPFSLASSPLDGYAQMNIKNMGPGTWTGDLYALAKAQTDGLPFSFNVDGPYGPPLELEDHCSLLLLAGGIGITAMHSNLIYATHLANLGQLPSTLKHVRLIWTARDPELFAMFTESLKKVVYSSFPQVKFTVSLYLTGQGTEKGGEFIRESVGLPFIQGRPDFKSLYSEMREDGTGTVLAKLCAPEGMDKSATCAAQDCSWVTYESELFIM